MGYKDFTYPVTIPKHFLYSLRNKKTGEEHHRMTFHLEESLSDSWDYFVFQNENKRIQIKCNKEETTDWQFKQTYQKLEEV
jgi:hypothetical protein